MTLLSEGMHTRLANKQNDINLPLCYTFCVAELLCFILFGSVQAILQWRFKMQVLTQQAALEMGARINLSALLSAALLSN